MLLSSTLLNRSSVIPSSGEFTLDSATITFDGALTKAHPKPGLNLYTPNSIYDPNTKDTSCAFRLNIADFNGRPYLIHYKFGIGVDRPIAVGRAFGNSLDDHPRPSIIVDANGYNHVLGINTHNAPAFDLRSNYVGDVYTHNEQPVIGQAQSYQQIVKFLDGTYGMYGQVDDSFPGINLGDANFENWGNDIEGALGGGGNQRYPTTPSRSMLGVPPNGRVPIIITDRPSDTWRRRFRLNLDSPVAGVCLAWNNDGTYSTSFPLVDDTELENFLYWETVVGGGSGDGFIPTPCMLGDHFFDTGYNSTSNDFEFIYTDPSGVTTKHLLGLADYVYDEDPEFRQQSAVTCMWAREINSVIRVYFTVIQDTTGTAKPYLYYTDDFGVTIVPDTQLSPDGQILPDILTPIRDCRFIHNYEDLPDDTNSIMYFSEAIVGDPSVGLATIFVKKCAFGTIQTDAPTTIYSAAPAMSFAELNALTTRAFYAEDSMITRTGTDITAFIDQSPNGLNATPVSTGPTYNSDDGEYASFNGTTQSLDLASVTDILAMTEGIVMVVAKVDVAATSVSFINGSNSGQANKRVFFGANKGGVFNNAMYMQNRQTTAVWTTYGDTDVSTGWHLFTYLCSAQRCSTMWMDGVKQWYNWDQTTTSNWNNTGLFFNNAGTGMNRVQIGRWLQGSSVFFQFKSRCHLIMPLVSFDNIRSAASVIASRYNITLTSSFE